MYSSSEITVKMMNENFGCNTFLLPDVARFNGIFPHFQTDQQKNLYVFVPTMNPMEYEFPQNSGSDENSPSEEEIFPDFPCKSCSVTFTTYREYQVHLASHDENIIDVSDDETSVPQPSVELLTEEDTPSPKSSNSDEEMPDSRDPKSFKFFSLLREHLKTHPDLKEVACVVCRSTFSCISSLRKHMLMFHCKNRDRKRCPYCNYRCFQSSDLEKHVARRHTRDFKYKCLFCVKGFATPKELLNHERRKHSVAFESMANPDSP